MHRLAAIRVDATSDHSGNDEALPCIACKVRKYESHYRFREFRVAQVYGLFTNNVLEIQQRHPTVHVNHGRLT